MNDDFDLDVEQDFEDFNVHPKFEVTKSDTLGKSSREQKFGKYVNFGEFINNNDGVTPNFSDVSSSVEAVESFSGDDFEEVNDLESLLNNFEDSDGNVVLDEDLVEDITVGESIDDYVEEDFFVLEYESDDELVFRLESNFESVLEAAIDAKASDVIFKPKDFVAFNILGSVYRQKQFPVIEPLLTTRLLDVIISEQLENVFTDDKELDTSYVIQHGRYSGRRFRMNFGRTDGEVFFVLRVISDVIPTPEDLDIPENMREWFNYSNGLIMVNGVTGSGKTTTIASLLREVQLTTRKNIITIEKPVEFLYGEDGKSFVIQRQVGTDTHSFSNANKSAMRENPHIIMLGEVRDNEEVSELLRAAESGHLSISTMHTKSSPATIRRIQSFYSSEEQERILGTLSDVSRGWANQVLLLRPDEKSRFAVREVLDINSDVRKFILKGDSFGLKNYQIEEGISMEQELVKAVVRGDALVEEAKYNAPDTALFNDFLRKLG